MENPEVQPPTQPVPQQPPRPRFLAPVIIVTSVVVVAALGYFLAVPSLQVSAYKKDASAKHQQVNDKMLRVYDSFKREAFTSTDSTPQKDKLDVQVARDAVKDAEDGLNANAPAMTKFSAWPLLDWNKAYKQATDTDAAEENYVKQARSFLSEYKVLLEYTDKTAAIGIKMESALKDLETLGNESDPKKMATLIDADVAKFKPVVEEFKALTPPDYLKDNTDTGTKVVEKLIVTLQDLAAGARTLDLDKLTKAAADATTEEADLDKASKDFVDVLQHKSPLQDHITKLRDLNSTIVAGYGKI
jgi:hypothetical protein